MRPSLASALVDIEDTASMLSSQGLAAEVFAIPSALGAPDVSIPATSLQDQPEPGSLMVFWESSDASCQG